MIIETLPDEANVSLVNNNDTILNDQLPTDMIHALHRDERELRILAVVLSLTGGLALSFLLGVGIFIYWHCRAWRTRQKKKLLRSKKKLSTLPSSSSSSSLSSSISRSTSHSFLSSASFQENDQASSSVRNVIGSSTIHTATITATPSSEIQSEGRISRSSISLPVPDMTTLLPLPPSLLLSSSDIISSSFSMSSSSSSLPVASAPSLSSAGLSQYQHKSRSKCHANEDVYMSSGNGSLPAHIPPLLTDPSLTAAPIPTAPPAKECLSPSLSHMQSSSSSPNNIPSLDNIHGPPPAYSPH